MKAGWTTNTLGELCEQITDGTHISPSYVEAGIPMLDSKHVKDGFIIDDTKPEKFISPATDALLAKHCKPRSGDILISSRGSIGKIAIVRDGQDFNIMGNMILIRLPTTISRKYVAYRLHHQEAHIESIARGVAQKGLYLGQVRGYTLSLPPLPEQQRIVAILDEAFDGIATATANAEQNLHNARALFESYLDAVFSQRTEAWVATTLGEVCRFENGDRGKNYPNRAEYVKSGIPWINAGHIQPDGTLSESEMNFISRAKYDSLRGGKIQQGDLVYCLRGALGKTALVDPLTVGAVASSLVIIRPGELADGRFIYYLLTSSVGQKLIKLLGNGAAQPNLAAQSVAKYAISLPVLVEQESIVHKLDALAAETKRLEAIYQRKLAALNELKQSLLHEAFSGEL